jgi:hypothetical protein
LREGLETFLLSHAGLGWQLPEVVRLRDYDLGHDERAAEGQPVRSVMGERLCAWQCAGAAEEWWIKCERHARSLLGPEGYAKLETDLKKRASSVSKAADDWAQTPKAQPRLFQGKPSLFDDGTEDPI